MRILIADDHPIVLQALISLLGAADDKTEVFGVSTLDEAIDYFETSGLPDLALVDFKMPGLGQPAMISSLCERFSGLKLAVISGVEDPDLALELMRRGALGFVPKTMAPAAMVHAVRLMAEGGRYLPDLVLRSAANSAADESSVSAVNSSGGAKAFGLTDRELEAVTELIGGRSNKEIARALGIEEVTVKLHLRRAFKKMGARNRADAVRVAMDAGLR